MMRYLYNCDKEARPQTEIQARGIRLLDSTVYIFSATQNYTVTYNFAALIKFYVKTIS